VAEHPLDNPIWEALHTHHAHFASCDGEAARYVPAVAPFAAVGDADPESSAALARLMSPGEHLYGVGPPPSASPLLQVEDHGPLAQMVWTAPFAAPSGAKVIPLTAEHLPDMLALTALVYPAYFRPRTPEMGRYLGIYDGMRLAAMAGERMHAGSWREVSAVCTHPDYVGRGLARQLMAEICEDIRRHGETPFLHVSFANERAKTLYDRLGFAVRSAIPYWLVRRSPDPVADGE
jgi:ribosomal protein S18 acetylase RimI-like enzyme